MNSYVPFMMVLWILRACLERAAWDDPFSMCVQFCEKLAGLMAKVKLKYYLSEITDFWEVI